ncbi:hypothetical protein ACE6H2_021698 [Prunus campanulata]
MTDESKPTNNMPIDHDHRSKKQKVNADDSSSWNQFAKNPTHHSTTETAAQRSTILDFQQNHQYDSQGVIVHGPSSRESSLRRLVEQVISELPDYKNIKEDKGGIWLVVHLRSRY